MYTGIEIVDSMINVIMAAVLSIIAAGAFIFGFYDSATPVRLLDLDE